MVFANSTLDIISPWAICTASDIKRAPNLSEMMEAPDRIEKKTGSEIRGARDNVVIEWETPVGRR